MRSLSKKSKKVIGKSMKELMQRNSLIELTKVGARMMIQMALEEEWVLFVLTLLLSMVGVGVIGVFIERVAYKPLRNAPRVSAIITALGVGIFLESIMLVIYPYPQAVPSLHPEHNLGSWGCYHLILKIDHHWAGHWAHAAA